MAKAKVRMTCADCGAEYWAEKACHNRSEANSWEEWMSGQEGCCPACYAKRMAAKRDAERAEATARAAEQSAAHNLPALTGTEKQVAWATTIRVQALNEALARHNGSLDNLNDVGRQVLAAAMAHMPTGASWWIDRRADAGHLTREELECANWARLDDARREAKMDEIRAAAAKPQPMGFLDRAELHTYERYERARLAGRGSLEQRRADEDAKRAALPPVPAKLADRLGKPGARWNGKFYGRDGLRVYLDGQECAVPAEVKAVWDAEWTAYKAAKAAGIK